MLRFNNYLVNRDRFKVMLNKHLDKHMLCVLMKKHLIKYKAHFREEPWIYNKINI